MNLEGSFAPGASAGGPPPLPPRPQTMETAAYNPYGSPAGMFGQPYGMGMSPYGGGYGGMYGMYNAGGMYGSNFGSPESNFVRIAEESSRGAFQSIESVVNAVASVANMLSSTHNAVFSSFRAVIGVVEQFSMMKKQIGGVLAVTVFHWLRLLWRRLLIFLRLKPANYASVEQAWMDTQRTPTAADVLPGRVSGSFSWPTLIFWLIALGGPYLIYRCVSKMVETIEESRKWATGASEHYVAQALYDFNASNQQELSFRASELLRVAPKSEQPKVRGWLLASSEDGARIGLVPINYVKIINRLTNSPPVAPSNPLDDRGTSQGTYEAAFPRRG
ncbi:PRX-13 protein [Aphelenchoides avenae]|nr:PRX-13 protein [Aphelenchus avenae]